MVWRVRITALFAHKAIALHDGFFFIFGYNLHRTADISYRRFHFPFQFRGETGYTRYHTEKSHFHASHFLLFAVV
jgi:hypothetical protein